MTGRSQPGHSAIRGSKGWHMKISHIYTLCVETWLITKWINATTTGGGGVWKVCKYYAALTDKTPPGFNNTSPDDYVTNYKNLTPISST
jgi:hypothetical protein